MRPEFRLPVAFALLISAGPGALAEREEASVTFGTGAFYSTGNYGFEDSTDILRLPVWTSLATGRFTFSAELPWLTAEGPADAANATRLGDTASRFPRLASRRDEQPGADSVSGIGDASFAATLRLTPDSAPTWAGLTFVATAPTGDESEGLGTGASDLSAEFGLEQRLGDFALYGSAGYVWPGNPGDEPAEPDTDPIVLEDYSFAALGARYFVLSGQSFGSGISWTESYHPELEDVMEASLSWEFPVSPNLRMGTFVSKGIAGEGKDFGIGMSLSFTPTH